MRATSTANRSKTAGVLCLVLALSAGSFLSVLAAAIPFYPDKANLLIYRDAQGKEHPVRKADDWAKRRAHILANMQEVMGPFPDAARKVPLDVQITETVREKTYTRKKLTFAAEPGDRVSAYLLVPDERTGKAAAVLCLHPTTARDESGGKAVVAGLGPDPDQHYARHLAERGYVTLAPDYPNFGGYKFDPYQHGYQSATMKGIWNHMRAVDLLQSLPEVDPERIGVVGHSLGGHNSMFVAVFDPRIKCVVSNAGFCSFPTYSPDYIKDAKKLVGWSHAGYMPRLRTVYGLDPAKIPFDFPEVVAALAPRAFLAIAPVKDNNFDLQGVKDCLTAAKPVYELLGAKEKVAGAFPDHGHRFSPEVQEAAYRWMDRWLKER